MLSGSSSNLAKMTAAAKGRERRGGGWVEVEGQRERERESDSTLMSITMCSLTPTLEVVK